MSYIDDLVEFLLNYINEDERLAKAAGGGQWMWWPSAETTIVAPQPTGNGLAIRIDAGTSQIRSHIGNFDPARALRAAEAKRRIVEAHEPYDSEENGGPTCWTCGPGGFPYPCVTLRLMAEEYAGREGWRDEWRHEP